MSRDHVTGVLMLVPISIMVWYARMLFFTEWALLLAKLTLIIAVATILGIVAWIRYTTAITYLTNRGRYDHQSTD